MSVAPSPIVAVRAADWPDVRGQRVLVGKAALGWRGDLRADSFVTQNGRIFVPVLTEHDWYRAEAEEVEVFAPLVPVARVWVEVADGPVVPDAAVVAAGAAPELRPPVPVEEAAGVLGRRVVCRSIGGTGFDRDLRAVSEVSRSTDGRRSVLVVKEIEWYRWAWSGRPAPALEVPAELVWVE